jgi:hypothetical protein
MEQLYTDLRGKDTSRVYQDINRSLKMANQYFDFTQRSNVVKTDVNPMLMQLQNEKTQLQNDNQLLKIQLVGCAGKACPPCPQCPSGGGSSQQPCPTCPQCPTSPDCQVKVNEYKQQIRGPLMPLNTHINSIRNELSRIRCFIGQNKEEKASIDRNLKSIEDAVRTVQAQ